MQPKRIGNIFIDRFGEWIGTLEDHAHALAQLDDVHFRTVNVVTSDFYEAVDAHIIDQIIHSIEAPQERGFAAAGRPNKRRDYVFTYVEGDVLQGLAQTIKQGQAVRLDERIGPVARRLGRR